MEYHDIPDYDRIAHWENHRGDLEVKLIQNDETVLHLVESPEDVEEIEDGCFYANSAHDIFEGLMWVREAEAFEMPSGIVDADYVSLWDSRKRETQHNVLHLNRDLQLGRKTKLLVAKT